MAESKPLRIGDALPFLYRRHPWHGIPIGEDAPEGHRFIEIVPTDTVKYELDKETGYLKVDRPQKFSNVYPTLYGFIPQTYCGEQIGAFCASAPAARASSATAIRWTSACSPRRPSRTATSSSQAIPIGGLRMIDGDEADDKIIAVLEGDAVYGGWREHPRAARRR